MDSASLCQPPCVRPQRRGIGLRIAGGEAGQITNGKLHRQGPTSNGSRTFDVLPNTIRRSCATWQRRDQMERGCVRRTCLASACGCSGRFRPHEIEWGTTPLGLKGRSCPPPKVGALRQPWALFQNAVGVPNCPSATECPNPGGRLEACRYAKLRRVRRTSPAAAANLPGRWIESLGLGCSNALRLVLRTQPRSEKSSRPATISTEMSQLIRGCPAHEILGRICASTAFIFRDLRKWK